MCEDTAICRRGQSTNSLMFVCDNDQFCSGQNPGAVADNVVSENVRLATAVPGSFLALWQIKTSLSFRNGNSAKLVSCLKLLWHKRRGNATHSRASNQDLNWRDTTSCWLLLKKFFNPCSWSDGKWEGMWGISTILMRFRYHRTVETHFIASKGMAFVKDPRPLTSRSRPLSSNQRLPDRTIESLKDGQTGPTLHCCHNYGIMNDWSQRVYKKWLNLNVLKEGISLRPMQLGIGHV